MSRFLLVDRAGDRVHVLTPRALGKFGHLLKHALHFLHDALRGEKGFAREPETRAARRFRRAAAGLRFARHVDAVLGESGQSAAARTWIEDVLGFGEIPGGVRASLRLLQPFVERGVVQRRCRPRRRSGGGGDLGGLARGRGMSACREGRRAGRCPRAPAAESAGARLQRGTGGRGRGDAS